MNELHVDFDPQVQVAWHSEAFQKLESGWMRAYARDDGIFREQRIELLAPSTQREA